MRVLYLHQYFNVPSSDGGGRSFEIARRLVQWGHEVHLVTADRSASSEFRVTDAEGITVHWLPEPYGNDMNHRDRIKAFLGFSLSASRLARRIDCDVIYATSTPLTIAIPGVLAKRKHNVPMVFEVRDLWPDVPIAIGALKSRPMIMAARLLEKFAYRSSDAVVALSPGMKVGVVATGFPADRVVVSPNASDLQLFETSPKIREDFRSRYEWLGDRSLVAYVGTLGLINGVTYMVELAHEVYRVDPEIRFLVVGSGREHDQIVQRAKELGVWECNFFMLEPMPRKEIPQVFAAADIVTSFVIDLPELEANSANKFFDGLASATPVAINYGGWQRNLLEEFNAGFWLHPHDFNEAAKNIVERLSDPSWLRDAGSAARNLAEQRFDRDKLTRQIEEVLLGVISKSQAKSA